MSHPHNPARAARRKVEALDGNPTGSIRCQYCGNTDPLLVRLRRIQNHHIFGDERDAITVPACLNCHAVAHEHLRDAEVPMTCEKEPTAFARAIFRALAVHFSLLAETCWRFAKKMEK
jgi:hypothetical protein